MSAAVFPDRSAPGLLDCTLRDGSFEVGFSAFTVEDTARICAALGGAGVRWIEVCDGMGIGGSRYRGEPDAPADAEHVAAACAAAPEATIGVISVPGIASQQDIDAVADAGARFLRVAIDVHRSDEAAALLGRARAAGLAASLNAMKSYGVPVPELVARARRAAEAGAQVCYLVDSAGTMTPNEVRETVAALVDAGIAIGFHGHDNLGLALANSLAAIEAGAAVVDGCLHGLGRSAGNAQTEVLAVLLRRLGHEKDIDIDALGDAAARLIAPRRRYPRGLDAVDIALGDAGVHSGDLPVLREVADQAAVPLGALIREVARSDRLGRLGPPRELIEAVARELQPARTA